MFQKIEREISNFINKPSDRNKTKVPNLGEFILYPLLTSKYTWKDISKSFIEECDARCVFWYVQGTYQQMASCPDLSNPSIIDRADRVFKATETSRNLVCYQAKFSQFAKSLTLSNFDDNRGFVPDDINSQIKKFYQNITSIKSWKDYFQWLDMAVPTDRNAELLLALQNSLSNGYHGKQQSQNNQGGRGGYGSGFRGRVRGRGW